MQNITPTTPRRVNVFGLVELLLYSITAPGWYIGADFDEVGLELTAGVPACRSYGCKIYKHRYSDVRVVWHNSNYGCPLG